jgi:hypothetical protein
MVDAKLIETSPLATMFPQFLKMNTYNAQRLWFISSYGNPTYASFQIL